MIREFTLKSVLSLFALSLLVFAAVSFVVSMFFYKRTISIRLIVYLTLALVAIDVFSKVLVFFCFRDGGGFSLFPGFISIEDVRNEYQAAYFQIAGVYVNGRLAGCIKLLAIPLVFLFLRIANIKLDNSLIRISLVFILSTIICTSLDSFIYGYTLDFIVLIPFTAACDLKDIYAVIALGLIIYDVTRQISSQIKLKRSC